MCARPLERAVTRVNDIQANLYMVRDLCTPRRSVASTCSRAVEGRSCGVLLTRAQMNQTLEQLKRTLEF